MTDVAFPFQFQPAFKVPARPFGVRPDGFIRHPTLTVTVENSPALTELLTASEG